MNSDNNVLASKHQDILSFRELSDRTLAKYNSCLSTYIDWVETEFPGKPIDAISWTEIRMFVRYLKDVKGLESSTINIYIAVLRDFYYYVLHRDWDYREVPSLRVVQQLPKVPTRDEVNAIIDSIVNPKHKAQIVLLYSSGMRVGEMCPLHCHDIHRKEKHIYIAHGKNGSDRNAILADRAVKDLITYIHECYKGAKPNDWLFPGQFPGTHVCEQTVANIFAQALARVGLADKGYTLHSLRHAFGLHLYDAGYNLMEIKEAMGHKSLSSTVVYLSLGIGNGRIVKSPYDFA